MSQEATMQTPVIGAALQMKRLVLRAWRRAEQNEDVLSSGNRLHHRASSFRALPHRELGTLSCKAPTVAGKIRVMCVTVPNGPGIRSINAT